MPANYCSCGRIATMKVGGVPYCIQHAKEAQVAKKERKFRITDVGRTEGGLTGAVGKLLPMSPEEGPPLPKALGVKWPGGDSSFLDALAGAVDSEKEDSGKYKNWANAALDKYKETADPRYKELARQLVQIAADEDRHALWLEKWLKGG